MPATRIHIGEAKQNKLFYFVATVVVYRESDNRCLILKRDEREKVHPGLYAVPGGKLEWKDVDIAKPTRINGDVLDFERAIDDLLIREAQEEAGIEIEEPFTYLDNVLFIRPDGIPVVLVKFAAHYKSGVVVPEEGAFTDFAWVNVDEVKKYKCVDGIADEVAQTIKTFANRST